MQYLFLAYGDEKVGEAMSAREQNAYDSACRANHERLRQQGHLLAQEELQHSRNVTTVRVCNGKTTVDAGPLFETEEQLNSIFLIDASDLNKAIYLASQMPQAQRGVIEVRPLVRPPTAHSWNDQKGAPE